MISPQLQIEAAYPVVVAVVVAANQTPRWDPATAGVMEDSGTEGHPLAALHWSGCLSYDLSLSFKSGVTYMTSKYCILTKCIDTHTNCTFIYKIINSF